MSRRTRQRAALRRIALTSVLLVACGSRTGLFGEDGLAPFIAAGTLFPELRKDKLKPIQS